MYVYVVKQGLFIKKITLIFPPFTLKMWKFYLIESLIDNLQVKWYFENLYTNLQLVSHKHLQWTISHNSNLYNETIFFLQNMWVVPQEK